MLNIILFKIKSVIFWLISGVYIKIPPITIHYNYIIIQRAPKSKTITIETIKEIPIEKKVEIEKIVEVEKIVYVEKKNDCKIISYRGENSSKLLNQFWNRYHIERSSWR
jgi:hypothetical protein